MVKWILLGMAIEATLRLIPGERIRSTLYYVHCGTMFCFRIFDRVIWRINSGISWIVPDRRKYPQNNPPHIWRKKWPSQ